MISYPIPEKLSIVNQHINRVCALKFNLGYSFWPNENETQIVEFDCLDSSRAFGLLIWGMTLWYQSKSHVVYKQGEIRLMAMTTQGSEGTLNLFRILSSFVWFSLGFLCNHGCQ